MGRGEGERSRRRFRSLPSLSLSHYYWANNNGTVTLRAAGSVAPRRDRGWTLPRPSGRIDSQVCHDQNLDGLVNARARAPTQPRPEKNQAKLLNTAEAVSQVSPPVRQTCGTRDFFFILFFFCARNEAGLYKKRNVTHKRATNSRFVVRCGAEHSPSSAVRKSRCSLLCQILRPCRSGARPCVRVSP